MATNRLNDDTQDLARCATCAVMAEADCHSGADANTVCAMCGMPMVYSPSERDDSVGALQGRTLGGGTHQPRLQFVVSLAAIGGGSGFIPRSRHDPKILWVDDAEIVGDRITKVRPILRNLFTQKTERRIGELRASCVALVVSDVSVHEAP